MNMSGIEAIVTEKTNISDVLKFPEISQLLLLDFSENGFRTIRKIREVRKIRSKLEFKET